MHRASTLTALAVVLSTLPFASSAQTPALSPNTVFFTVDNYYDLDAQGDFRPYRASGFYEPGGPQTQPRVFLLPQVSVDREKIKFFSGGQAVSLGFSQPASSIQSINIPLRYSGSLPTRSQGIGIAVQTGGEPQPAYIPAPIKDGAGNPAIHPGLGSVFQIASAVREDYAKYTEVLKSQERNLARWKSFRVESTTLNELAVSLVIDGDIVAQRFVAGTAVLSGSLPMLAVKNPTEDVVRRVADGNFEVQASYRFRDAKVGSIDASFDVDSVLDSYVQESQSAVTTSKSSGMQLFHLGSRRTKVKQSLERNFSASTNSESVAQTSIVMNDADEKQVERFEATFFPSLSQQQTVTAHLEAADEAKAAGNVDLAKVHLQYAQALQQGVALAEVDAVGAAAALNKGDYATFLAKGVRFMDASTKSTGTFFRVARERVTTSDSKSWTDVSKRSVQREVTMVLRPEEPPTYRPRLGMCEGRGGPANTLLITCIQENSPLSRAGVQAGEIIMKIANRSVGTAAALSAVLEDKQPGETVDIVFVDLNGATLTRRVKLGRHFPH